ncbi:MAG: hypothetical protein GF355_01300, partial [Candidatus Eisenbacteria bacterium]|nr:hypothetical protein [Candidatus Eisenbacteria bacterium]
MCRRIKRRSRFVARLRGMNRMNRSRDMRPVRPGTSSLSTKPWGIVYTVGAEKSLRRMIRHYLGEGRPKPYCTFTGSRSLIQHSLDRARRLVGPRRIVTVANLRHREFFRDAVRQPVPGETIYLPRGDRGTGTSVFYALAHIIEQDPNATVLLLPADHFVYPEERFFNYVRYAQQFVASHPSRIAVLGAIPDRPEPGYG